MQKKMLPWTLLFLLAYVHAPQTATAAENQAITPFKKMLEQTLDNNPRILTAREKLKAAQALLPQAQSQLLPSVALQWDNTYSSSQWQDGDSHADPTAAALSLSQALFNLEALRDYRRLAPTVKAAQKDLETIRQQVFLDFVELTTNLRQEQDVFLLSENNYNLTKSHLNATQARFEAGELTKTDVSQSLARVYAAKAGWIAARANSQSSEARFVELTGQEAPPNLEIPVVKHELLSKPLAELVALVAERPDIEAEQWRMQVAEGNVEARKAGYMPKANLSSSTSRTWDPASSAVAGPQDTVTMTLGLSWPLYSGGLTGGRIDQAISERESQLLQLDQARLAAIRELKVALLEFEKNAAIDQANVARVTAAQDAMDGVSQEYQVGTRTSLDTLDAQNELFSAQTEKVKSSYGLNLSRFRVLKTLGMLALDKLESSFQPASKHDALRATNKALEVSPPPPIRQ